MHSRFLGAALAAAAILISTSMPCIARADGVPLAVADFNLPAQPLADSLRAVATETQTSVLFDAAAMVGRQAPPLKARLTVDEAVTRLLAGSGLTHRRLNDKTIVLAPAQPERAGPADTAARRAASRAVLLRLAEGESEKDNKAAAGAQEPAAAHGTEAAVPELLVKGSRILNVDIKRTENDAQPYVVFDREEIERSMAANLEDFLKTRLPMNAVQGTNTQTTFNNLFTSQSTINLRGLGAAQTLILVDGRRLPGVNAGGTFNQPDINGIPLSTVERIEVLPATASGIYGGSATGGVVNIITRRDYSGLDLKLTYGNTFDSDVSSRRIEARAGFNLEGGRTQVLLSGSYADANPLLTGERDLVARGRALQLHNNPNVFFAGLPPVGYTPNIRNTLAPNLRLKQQFGGTILTSPFTTVPVGYAGVASDNAAALVANAGHYNFDLPDTLAASRQTLLGNPTTESAALNLRRSFLDARVDAFLDGGWLYNEGHSIGAPVPTAVQLGINHPNNPFTTAVVVTFPSTGLSIPDRESQAETLRATGGVIVRLPRGWTAAADYAWSRTRFEFAGINGNNAVVGDPDGPGTGLSVDQAFANGSLNVLRDLNAYPLDFTPYLMPVPSYFFGPADTVFKNATLRLSGSLFKLPAGPLSISSLIEHNEAEAKTAFQRSTSGAAVTTGVYFPGRSQKVTSYYLEARAPLVSNDNALPFVRALDLQASVRRDEYQTRAPNPTAVLLPATIPPLVYVTNEVQSSRYTLGLRYSPSEDLMLRASTGTGFLPPSIGQIVVNPTISRTLSLIDPKRTKVAQSTGPIDLIAGGNPDLRSEESKNWSAGLVFTPRFLPDLRLSMDYSSIKKTNEITSLSVQLALDLEDVFPGQLVKRLPLTQQDIDAGYTGGAITEIRSLLFNAASTTIESYDLQTDYLWRTSRGDLQVYAVATWQPRLDRQVSAASPLFDFVGFSDGVLEWRGNGGVNWSHGPMTLGWSAQYYDAYRVYGATVSPTVIATAVLNQGSAFIPSQIYHDFFLRWRFADAPIAQRGLFENMEVSVGVQNVFNRYPPVLATTAYTGGYSTYGDPRLRRYSISVRKNFGL